MSVKGFEFYPTSGELRNFEYFSNRIISAINYIIFDEADKGTLYSFKFRLEILLKTRSSEGVDTNILNIHFAFDINHPPTSDLKDKLRLRIDREISDVANRGQVFEEITRARLAVSNKSGRTEQISPI